MAPTADWIEFTAKTSAFKKVIADDVAFHMNAYHRKIAYAAKVKRALANPRGRRLNLRIDKMWYAHQVSKAIINSAAADLAAAKAMLRAEEIYAGMFEGRTAASANAGGGMDMDH